MNVYKTLKSKRVRSRYRNAILARFGSLHNCAKFLESKGRYANCCVAYSAVCGLTCQRPGLRYHNGTLAEYLQTQL